MRYIVKSFRRPEYDSPLAFDEDITDWINASVKNLRADGSTTPKVEITLHGADHGRPLDEVCLVVISYVPADSLAEAPAQPRKIACG